jgi:hypothetical protein
MKKQDFTGKEAARLLSKLFDNAAALLNALNHIAPCDFW